MSTRPYSLFCWGILLAAALLLLPAASFPISASVLDEQQEQPPRKYRDYASVYEQFADSTHSSSLKAAGFLVPGVTLSYTLMGRVNDDNPLRRLLFLFNIAGVLALSEMTVRYFNVLFTPSLPYENQSTVDELGNGSSAVPHLSTAFVFGVLNIVAEMHNSRSPSSGTWTSYPENFAIGAKSIGVTSNIGTAIHIGLDQARSGLNSSDQWTTAHSSRDVALLYMAFVMSGSSLGLLDATSADTHYFSSVLNNYATHKIPYGMSITAAYETTAALYEYCTSSLLNSDSYSESEKARLCLGGTSVFVAMAASAGIASRIDGFLLVYLSNAVESAGVAMSQMTSDIARNLFEHPAARDISALLSTTGISATSLMLNRRYTGLFMTNISNGMTLMAIYELVSAISANLYPTLAMTVSWIGDTDQVHSSRMDQSETQITQTDNEL